MLELSILLLLVFLVTALLLALIRQVFGRARSNPASVIGWCAAILLAALIVAIPVWRLAKSRTIQLFGSVVSRVETKQKVVALTFDDGPTQRGIDNLLPLLQRHGVKATFFVIGHELQERPELGRRIVEAGHELANHSYSHDRMILKSPRFIESELKKTDQLIRQAGEREPIDFRPPFGKKLIVLPYQLAHEGRPSIMWDLEPDTDRNESGAIVDDVVTHVRPGSIILLHVMYGNRDASLAAVEPIIVALQQKGYSFATVRELRRVD